MATSATYNDFRAVQLWRNKYRRPGEFAIWDANLRHGDLRPFACPELACEGAGDLQTLYPLPQCKCAGYDDVRDIVRGFCEDQHLMISGGRLRYVDETTLCNGGQDCLAGAPFSPAAPTVNTGCVGECDGVGVSYVVTFVTRHAGIEVESAPSPASPIVASNGHIPGALVTWGAAPGGYCVVATRLYRVETTFEDGTTAMPAQGAEFVFVAQFGGGGGGNFTDIVPSSETGGPLTTYEPMAFPAPGGLRALVRTEDGIAVADDDRVYISIAGQPQFSYDGVVEIEDQILGMAAINNTIFVFTDNKPVKIGYRHTQGVMSIDRQVVHRKLPLRSRRSLSAYGDRVYFSSTRSLYSWDISGYGADIGSALTPLVTPEQWRNMDPDSITGTAHEFGYIFSSDRLDHSLFVEFAGEGTDTSLPTSMMPISYINADRFALDYNGDIVYQQDGDVYCWQIERSNCRHFDIHDNQVLPYCERCGCCPWKAEFYYDNEGKNRFSKMRVEWDERSDTSVELLFRHRAFGNNEVIIGPMEILSSRGFSIPQFKSSQTVSMELSSCGIVHELKIATSYQELVNSSNNQLANAG